MAVESPLMIVLDMIGLIINSIVRTVGSLIGMFLELIGSLGFISAIGGGGVLVLSVIIIAVVVFFLGKFVFSAGKGLILLFMAGAVVVLLLVLGLAFS